MRPAARPERLIPLVLAFALLVPLTWCLVRTDRGDPPAREPGARGSGTPRPREKELKTAETPTAPKAAKDGKLVESTRRNRIEPRPDPSPRGLLMPVAGVDPRTLQDTFSQSRGGRPHEALDILAPRGTPVLAAGEGVVRKLFTSVRGGLTVYQFDLEERYCYYYAHLDGYAASLHEGQLLRRGDVVGTVGATGNAREDAPHLHFAVVRLDADKRWWEGTPVNPYPLLVGAP